MDGDQIKELLERIEILERKLSKISFNEAKEVTLTNCPIGDLSIGNNCKMDFQNSSIGSVMDTDIEDAACRIDDLESRLEEVNARIDEAESRMDEMEEY